MLRIVKVKKAWLKPPSRSDGGVRANALLSIRRRQACPLRRRTGRAIVDVLSTRQHHGLTFQALRQKTDQRNLTRARDASPGPCDLSDAGTSSRSPDPEAIHQLGWKEVGRIEAEQLVIAKRLGFSDIKSFRASLKGNAKLIPASGQQLLDAYRHHLDNMEPQLPKLFGLLPKTKIEVRPVEPYREKEAAAAEYYLGTPNGSRPVQSSSTPEIIKIDRL
jgi:uncharacterized protein DUF885